MHIVAFIWEFLKGYWLDIIIIVGVAFGLVMLIRKGKKAQLILLAKMLVSKAESYLGSGTGRIKLEAAVSWLREKSVILRWFFTVDEANKLIEDAVTWLNSTLTDAERKLILESGDSVFVADGKTDGQTIES